MVESDKHWIRLGRMDPYLKTVQTLDPYKRDGGATYVSTPTSRRASGMWQTFSRPSRGASCHHFDRA
jgi:hypothetical protein